MFGSVDLNELAKVSSSSSRLLDGFASGGAWQPDPSSSHPASKRLTRHQQAVTLEELLTGQRGSKIGVLLSNNRQNVDSEGFRPSVVADLAALLGYQALRALSSVTSNQAAHLPRRHAEHGCSLSLVQSPVFNAL